MKTIQVHGPLAALVKGLPITDIRDMIGKPITDESGNVIGAITSIDADNWHGYINGVLEVTKKECSFSIN